MKVTEYINRKQAIKEILEAYEYEFPTASGAFDEFVTKIIPNILKSIPAANVAPVVHEKWECGEPCPCCGEDRFKGLDADIWADWEPPYCPNCGANMSEVK